MQAFTLMAHLNCMPETQVAAALMNDGMLADRLRAAGVPVYVLNERDSSSLKVLMQVRGILCSWRPNIVHTHREKENILGSIATKLCRNVPSVRTVHGSSEHSGATGLEGMRRWMVAGLDRWCGRALQRRIVAVTRELGAAMMGEFPAERVAVIENGIDSEAVRRVRGVAEFRAAEPDATHVGIAGRLVKVKRVDIFLETSALLLRQYPERKWRFHVFGDGPVRRKLEELAVELNLDGTVAFHGHREDIATCVGGLDVLVICSDHEGMPMISLEATALGVPLTAHAVGGLNEVVPKEFLVSRHDAHGYRDGILRTLCDDGRGVAAQQAATVLTQFSAQRNAERIRALYEQVVAESGNHGMRS